MIAAIFYVSNWWYIAKDVNYFEQFSFMPLKHLWSLAIEEQFYLFFPAVLLLFMAIVKKKKNVILIFWIISLVSLLMMVVISQPHLNHSRVYFGTDTRLQTLLLGVLLAFIWPPFKLNPNPPKGLKTVINSAGIIGLTFLILLFFTVSDESDWIYNGGFYLISTMTLLIIASVVHPTTILAKLLGNPLFVYIGKRSYSLYLWHFPVISFIHSYFIDGQLPTYVYIMDIVITVLLAELSFRYVETPLRKEGLKAFTFKKTYKPQFIRTIVTLIMLLPFIFILVGAFDKFGKDTISNKAQTFNTNEADQYLIHMIPIDNISLTSDGKTKENKKDNDVYTQIKPLLIGDSVMVDIGEQFKTKVPKAKIDGKVGRQLYQAESLVKNQYRHYNKPSDQIILELGTNGDFTKEQLDNLIDKFGKAQVYLVNTRVPRSYESHVNELMAKAAKNKKNVTLIDWYSRSKGHTEYFAPDGIHLENDGVEALTDEILKNIKKK